MSVRLITSVETPAMNERMLMISTDFFQIKINMMAWLQALLLLAGDIETNPGPPKNRGGPPGGVYKDIHTKIRSK